MLPSFCLSSLLLTIGARAVGLPAHPSDLQGGVEPSSTLDVKPTKTSLQIRGGILGDIDKGVHSVLSELGSAIPSYVASGIPNYFQNFPSGKAVQSSLRLNDRQVAALPTQVLNIPSYANWTKHGWNLRLHGNVYKQPNLSRHHLNNLANVFVPDKSVQNLPPSQASQARNLTAEIFVLQQDNVQPTFNLIPKPTSGTQIVQAVVFPYRTTAEGDYDAFVPISNAGLRHGGSATSIQQVDVHTQGSSLGNATAYLVPKHGLTVVSDVDDVLRITRIYKPEQGLLNSFVRPFRPWRNMPEIYANWSRSIKHPEIAFHYLTTTPEQITRNYMSFIYATYPLGSFDTRPLNFSNVEETLHVRLYLLRKIFATFPHRKFILVGDTSNSDIMQAYPKMVKTGQVQCIFLRNTSATDPGDEFPYDTSGFKDIPQSKYMFFVTPSDLMHLDIAGGQCYNRSVQQNVTFGYQGLPLEINSSDRVMGGRSAVLAAGMAAFATAVWFFT